MEEEKQKMSFALLCARESLAVSRREVFKAQDTAARVGGDGSAVVVKGAPAERANSPTSLTNMQRNSKRKEVAGAKETTRQRERGPSRIFRKNLSRRKLPETTEKPHFLFTF